MTAADLAAWGLLGFYALWVFFLAAMNLARAQAAGTLPDVGKVLGLPLVALAFLLDVAINLTAGTVLLIDWPREWTLSERLERLKAGTGWRAYLADWTLRYLLDPFDTTGGHRPR